MTIRPQLDPLSGVPFYRQIIDQVKAAIATGTIGPGDRLPTVRQLAVDLSVETMGLGAMGGLTAFDRILGSNGGKEAEEPDTLPDPGEIAET